MANPNLFKTVSSDNLHFWEGAVLNYQKLRDFTGFDVRDIARMTGAAKSSVRFDSKAPKEVREHLENIANICNLVFQFFQDEVKTKLWLRTPNPMLGNMSPRAMLRLGRCTRLLRFVNEAIEDGSAGAEASPAMAATI
jgi:Protein of unknown function (DUF2384)